jgi:hypothetical protein
VDRNTRTTGGALQPDRITLPAEVEARVLRNLRLSDLVGAGYDPTLGTLLDEQRPGGRDDPALVEVALGPQGDPANSNKFGAIKFVRMLTGWDLKDTKDFVDALERPESVAVLRQSELDLLVAANPDFLGNEPGEPLRISVPGYDVFLLAVRVVQRY